MLLNTFFCLTWTAPGLHLGCIRNPWRSRHCVAPYLDFTWILPGVPGCYLDFTWTPPGHVAECKVLEEGDTFTDWQGEHSEGLLSMVLEPCLTGPMATLVPTTVYKAQPSFVPSPWNSIREVQVGCVRCCLSYRQMSVFIKKPPSRCGSKGAR